MSINWTNIYLEEDLRELWGDFVVDDLLEIMNMDELSKWIHEPIEELDNRTLVEIAKEDGVELVERYVEDLINDIKHGGYS